MLCRGDLFITVGVLSNETPYVGESMSSSLSRLGGICDECFLDVGLSVDDFGDDSL